MNKKIKLWTITDGSQGMISQANGLAQFLAKDFIQKKVTLKWPWSLLQPGLLPINKYMFNDNFLQGSKPDIVISCGRQSVYASLYLKKILKKRIITIHIQNPKIKSNNFDYIISPNHDNFFGVNVINSIGALHYLTKKKINNAVKTINIPKNRKIVSIIIGGDNNHYLFNENILNNFLKKIKILNKNKKKYFFLFIPSRRTNKNFINIISKSFKKNTYVWNKKTINPYVYSLKISDFFIVTSDSTSMISEVSYTTKPLFVFHLPFKRNSKRMYNFHKEFKKMGITRPFRGDLRKWTYKPLDESKRIARILKSRILK